MWIVQNSKAVENKLKRIRSNAAVLKKLASVSSEIRKLRDDDDPRKLGIRKTGQYKNMSGTRLTDSYR